MRPNRKEPVPALFWFQSFKFASKARSHIMWVGRMAASYMP